MNVHQVFLGGQIAKEILCDTRGDGIFDHSGQNLFIMQFEFENCLEQLINFLKLLFESLLLVFGTPCSSVGSIEPVDLGQDKLAVFLDFALKLTHLN